MCVCVYGCIDMGIRCIGVWHAFTYPPSLLRPVHSLAYLRLISARIIGGQTLTTAGPILTSYTPADRVGGVRVMGRVGGIRVTVRVTVRVRLEVD